LDFVPPDWDFVPSSLDFVPNKLDFLVVSGPPLRVELERSVATDLKRRPSDLGR
jgi:hypothetical protein